MLLFANLDNRALHPFRAAGLVSLIGPDHFFYRIHDAVLAAATGRVTVKPLPAPPSDEQPIERWARAIKQCIVERRQSVTLPVAEQPTGDSGSGSGDALSISIPDQAASATTPLETPEERETAMVVSAAADTTAAVAAAAVVATTYEQVPSSPPVSPSGDRSEI